MMATTPTSFDWQTPQHLNLDTTIPATFTADDLDLESFSAGSSLPSISINQCEHVPNVASPSSDVPSLWSDTTRASSPSLSDMPPTSAPLQYASMAQQLSGHKPFTSPMEPHTAPSWEFMAQASSSRLQPATGSSRGHSRRTSATSLSASSDENAMSPIAEVEDDLLPLAPAPRLPRQGIFAAHTESPTPGSSRSSFTDRSRALATTPLPSRFEAETLTTEFVQYIESLQYRAYNISPPLFSRLCENVYPNPQRPSSSVDMSVSIPMARFHVFFAMAIAMKLRIRDSPENTNALLDTCYELAMQQTSPSTFWQAQGGFEATQLLAIFASLRRAHIEEPRPLQQSFSW
ncbi:hypothetical protein CC86DRAFT_185053 [Ophiobolus disseminans]|uniref:Uncharacterized protein n=1 Tax=Ophiobolus disseminans TaxID=1469910 RepID=A0A6A7A950_9PLEO|nr:hypothetical protein CC86DRAFT_185053 [Ophiobolus disseminans]